MLEFALLVDFLGDGVKGSSECDGPLCASCLTFFRLPALAASSAVDARFRGVRDGFCGDPCSSLINASCFNSFTSLFVVAVGGLVLRLALLAAEDIAREDRDMVVQAWEDQNLDT